MSATLKVGDRLQYSHEHNMPGAGTVVRVGTSHFGTSYFNVIWDGETIERCFILEGWERYFIHVIAWSPGAVVIGPEKRSPCITCGKGCDSTDRKCWWCGELDPIGAHGRTGASCVNSAG